MGEPVPTINSLDALYPPENLATQMQRWDDLYKTFSSLYNGITPHFVARSPGRVNILGEHIDYSLYEVLPMAILADVLIAASTSSPSPGTKEATISISNINSEKYSAAEFAIPSNGDMEVDASNHSWSNYFKAGCKGALELLRRENPNFHPLNMSILVDGNVPAGGGLSSSAAFVCASALAVLRAHGETSVIKKELVELAIVSERSVGVNSGGMDQSASVFSIRGDALSVSFSPELHAEAIAFLELDPPITFMIAQSFVVSDKHVTAPECYNLRVVECTLAAEVLAQALDLTLSDDASPLGRSLRTLQAEYFRTSKSPSSPDNPNPSYKKQLEQMLELTNQHLTNTIGYTRSDVASLLHISIDELSSRYLTKFPIRTTHFHLYRRATHVLNEALRVLEFKSLLTTRPPPSDLLPRLGALMNETQTSCREVYDCSCPELDELCEIARNAGAYGSRLTGAGWGGCTVHLVPKGKVDAVRQAWVEKYYRKREPGISEERLEEAVVVSEPGQGSVM